MKIKMKLYHFFRNSVELLIETIYTLTDILIKFSTKKNPVVTSLCCKKKLNFFS